MSLVRPSRPRCPWLLAVAAVALPALAFAGEAPQRRLEGVVLEARSVRVFAPTKEMATRLVVEVKRCDGKPCAEQLRVWVAGGRIGDEEQRVAGLRAPDRGDAVAFVLSDGHLHLEPSPPPALARAPAGGARR